MTSLISTRTRRPPLSTLPAPPATRRAFTSVIANSFLHTLSLASSLGTAPGQGRMHREDVYMPITPMFHVHAWGFPYLATMLGLRQVYPGKYLPESLLRLIRDEKVSYSHCVPTILHMLLTHPLAAEIDFKGWKIVIGGSAMPQAQALAAMKRGIDLFTGYGMSETCPVLTLANLNTADLDLSAEDQAVLRAKTGRPMPLVDLRIVDAEMDDVAHDGIATGEVVVRTPWLTQGYLKAPEAAEALWDGGLSSHRRHRPHRCARFPQDHRPHQGRDQDRRRMDLLAGAGRCACQARGRA